MNKFSILFVSLFFLFSINVIAQTLGERAYPNDKVSQKIVNENSWQTTSGGYEQHLYVRNKAILSDAGIDYEVTFIVTDILINKDYIKTIIVNNDDWASVTFPSDFQTEEEKIYRLDSEFKWVGQIDGVTRVWGSFSNAVFDE